MVAFARESLQHRAMQHDVFICHASEDKNSLVRPLANALRAANLDVWYDEFSLDVGDSLREAIDRGLAGSRYGIVVLSPSFFKKPWTQRELNGLVAREIGARRKLILPVWHGVTQEDVLRYSPPLADAVALQSSLGVDALAEKLIGRVRSDESPFIVARDELVRFGREPPPFSDEWWLDVVEMQGDVDAPQWQRPLVFPLPAKLVSSGRDRGLNIAWTSLQLDWQQDAEDEAIDQMTHPDDALAFIRARPELMEVCQAHPERLANYLPQLLIPEFSAEFGAAFDHLLERSMAEKVTNPDGRRPNAKCARYLALRHPTLGDHTAIDVAKRWVRGQGGFISAAASPEIQYIFWLLGDESHWLPPAIRNVLISGLRSNGYWVAESLINLGPSSALFKACFDAKSVKWTKSQRQELLNLIDEANRDLGLLTPPLEIAERFIAADIVGGFHEILVERKQRGRK